MRKTTPKLSVKKLHEDAILPTRGTDGSAGLDLYAVEDYELRSGDICCVRSGIAVELPVGTYGLLATRSSYGKYGVRIAAGCNIVDCDYRGEVLVYLRNDGEYPWYIKKGERMAQMVVTPYTKCDVVEAEELSDTGRGKGGFGSTGR